MSEIGPRTRIRANPDHLLSMVRDEAVLLRLGRGNYYALNPLGVRVWALLQVERTIAELVEHIVVEYDVEAPRAELDVITLVRALDGFDLIELRDGP